MRGPLISRASYLKRQREKAYADLLRQLRDVTNAHLLNPSDTQAKSIIDITNQINTMTLHKTAYMLTKLRMKTYTQGNKAGKHLATMLKQKQANSKIPYLVKRSGEKIHNPQDINDEMAEYYQTLYNLKNDPTVHQHTKYEIDTLLQKTTLPTLSEAQIQKIQDPITVQ
ncbi:guanine nucleotide-binding G(o) subunit alpha [Pelobates cultripes]|uniref:Guanine nucleotide-binding G(O) subunit alpha n=1 Tax=Pelobates cultripes TaxID=61616 RepID=A0AAD1RD91_PELCU|nr:guanine nucleotide-binding G(o) subunit alpha [Pelobates cultripes]